MKVFLSSLIHCLDINWKLKKLMVKEGGAIALRTTKQLFYRLCVLEFFIAVYTEAAVFLGL